MPTRCQPVKIQNCEQGLKNFYNDIQEDYKINCFIFLNWLEIGFTKINENNELIVVEPEDQIKQIVKYAKNNPDIIEKIKMFMGLLVSGQTSSSSNYSIFYEDYQPKETAKYNQNLMNNPIIFEELRKKNKGLQKITIKEWGKHVQKFKNLTADQKKQYWNKHIAAKVVNSDRAVGKYLRENLKIKCKRPKDHSYCCQLTEMIRRTVSSVFEKYKIHIDEWNEIKTHVDSFVNDDLFLSIQKLIIEAKKKNIEHYSHILRSAIRTLFKIPIKINKYNQNSVKYNQDSINYFIENMSDICQKYEYDKCMQVINNIEFLDKFNHRRKYPLFPELKDYKVPFGLTGQGNFRFEQPEEIFQGKLNGYNFKCCYSNYFDNLKIIKIGDSYEVEFNHRLKNRGKNKIPTSPTIKGIVKEIGLLKKGDTFELTIAYNLPFNESNFKLQNYFRSSSPSEKEFNSLNSEFVAAGVDLNIQNPLVVTKGVVSKNKKYPLIARDFGRAKVIETLVLVDSTKFADEIKSYCRKIDVLKSVIKEIKICKNKLIDVSFDTLFFLEEGADKSQAYDLLRHKFQFKIKEINSKLSSFWHRSRKIGHRDISAMLRLLELQDMFDSMSAMYDRIHLKMGETLPAKPKFNSKRINFKKDFLKKLACKLTRYCVDNNVSIVFLEDLDSKQSSKNSQRDNALIRLFSAKGILDAIKNSLEKYGIYCVEVDKKGTSKTDPLTGKLAYRDVYNKSNLFVVRQNKPLCLDSDMAASKNIFLKGIDHSIIPYNFYKSKTYEFSKRMMRFLKDRYKTSKIHFYIEGNRLIPSKKKLKKDEYFGRIYYSQGKYFSEEQQKNNFKELEAYFTDGSVVQNKIEKFDVNFDKNKSCVNFQV